MKHGDMDPKKKPFPQGVEEEARLQMGLDSGVRFRLPES